MGPLDELRTAVEAAAAELRNGKPSTAVRPTLERPKKAGFGDYSTNAAMLLAPALGAPPREIAERLAASCRAAGRAARARRGRRPGLPQRLPGRRLVRRRAGGPAGRRRRRSAPVAGAAEKVLVEFVSANPTGPLTAARGRHAAFGDALARILEFAGHSVDREYYFNDAGSQVDRLGESIRARARGEEVPEDGYQGEYVDELAPADRGRGRRATPTSWPRAASRRSWPASGRRSRPTASTSTPGSSSAGCTRASRAPSSARSRCSRSAATPTAPRARCGCARRTFGDDKDRVLDPLERRDDLLRRRHRLPRGQARARLRPPDQPARRRPPRLHRADEGGDGGARRRPGPARDPDPAVRAHRRGRARAPRCPSAAATSSRSTT